MSTNPITKIDPEKRNAQGFPEVPPEAKNVCQIGGNQQPVDANVRQIYGINLQLPWFVLLALIAGAALALVIDDKSDRPQQIEMAIRVAKAETEARLAPVISKLQTDMERAKQDADLARDFVDRKNAELKQLAESKRK